jgi:hypothetical protein
LFDHDTCWSDGDRAQNVPQLDTSCGGVGPIVTKLFQEYMDVFPYEIPLGLPPMRGIEHKIDLILGASLPNHAVY